MIAPQHRQKTAMWRDIPETAKAVARDQLFKQWPKLVVNEPKEQEKNYVFAFQGSFITFSHSFALAVLSNILSDI
jgi:hypothetical protein